MSEINSIGIVNAKTAYFSEPLTLKSGEVLPQFDLTYETYGELNTDASNAVLVCHALSGTHHVAGKYKKDDKHAGWWDILIGPGKPLDTNKFLTVSLVVAPLSSQ